MATKKASGKSSKRKPRTKSPRWDKYNTRRIVKKKRESRRTNRRK